MALSRSEIIQANPIGNRLQAFRESFNSTHPEWSAAAFDQVAKGKQTQATDHSLLGYLSLTYIHRGDIRTLNGNISLSS